MRNNPLPIKAAVYLRRSTDRQEQSIFSQKTAIQSWAKKNNIKIIKYFVDDAISGTDTKSRKAFLEMISEGTSPNCPFSVILVYSIDRFGRIDPDEAGHFEHVLKCNGVTVQYIAEPLSPGQNTLGDVLVKSLKRAMALEFAKDQAKKTIRGSIVYTKLGYSVGGRPPYGYDRLLVDKNGKPIKVLKPGQRKSEKTEHVKYVLGDPEKVKTVKKIFDLVANKGLGLRKVAERLNVRKIPSSKGQLWCASSIRSILRNPIYKGVHVWNRSDRFKGFNWKSDTIDIKIGDKKTKIVQRWKDSSEWVYSCENAHTPIISKKLFTRAQQTLTMRKKYFSGSKIKILKKNIKKKQQKNLMRKDLILMKIKTHELFTLGTLAENLKVNKKTIERDIGELKSEGKIRFIGPKRGGHYELLKN